MRPDRSAVGVPTGEPTTSISASPLVITYSPLS
jgi:hypothetical protein